MTGNSGSYEMLVATVLALMLQVPAVAEPASPSDRLAQTAGVVAASPHTTLRGYVVSGRDLRSVREAMTALRPSDSSGARHDAHTSWLIQPMLMKRGGECDAQRSYVEYSATVTLPDLETPDALSPSERATWDRYFSALVAHEINHLRIVQEGSERVQAAMRAATGCEAIDAAAGTAAAAIDDASAQYDQRTRHGATEGAVLVIGR